MKRTITYRKAQLSDSMALYELVCDLEGVMLSYEKFYDILNEQLQDRQHYYFLVCEHEGRNFISRRTAGKKEWDGSCLKKARLFQKNLAAASWKPTAAKAGMRRTGFIWRAE